MLQAAKPLLVPAAILLLAAILALAKPPGQIVLFIPYLVLPLGAAIALWFNRGRAFFSLISLLLAYVGLRLALDAGAFAVRATLTFAAIFVSLNMLLAAAVPERGVFHFRSYRWLLLLLGELLLAAWVAGAGATPVSGTFWHEVLNHWLLRLAPSPFVGRLLLAMALSVVIARSWEHRTPVDVGIGGALIAVFVAFTWLGGWLPVFLSAAGAILLLAVLQESHRMAFLDELTGLPGRRALEEQLLALGPLYTVAMVDIDHFKKFNDTHGHDVGDQVLKLVAARLAQITGGGRAFRYGGEEFCVLFPESALDQALPHLEELREAIARYQIAVRTQQRRKESRSGPDRRIPEARNSGRPRGAASLSARTANPPQDLSVTISIGVAEPGPGLASPAKVIKAADQALYRAKEAGRNRVSR
jgi:diguanylate cyclase (GGDEF)-like protein